MVFVILATAGLSRVFACATPFAAVAATAACTLPRRHAAVLVALVWMTNQAIGFGMMGYPHTAATVGWGVAIGLAALAALGAAQAVRYRVEAGTMAAAAMTLPFAFAAYEAVLAAAASALPSGPGAFAVAVMVRILAINAVALGLLVATHRLAVVVTPSRPGPRLATPR